MPKGTVLVVESNPGVLIVARNVLGRRGHTVLCAADPDDGLEKARADLPDLVILDGSFATPEVLRALSDCSPVRIPLLVSAPTGLGAEVQARLPRLPGIEVPGVLEKPFTPDALADTVHEVLLDYHRTRPLRIDSARFAQAVRTMTPAPAPEAVEPPARFDPEAVRVTPAPEDPVETSPRASSGPCIEPPVLEADPADEDDEPTLATSTETIQETLDAEAACDLIDMAVLGIEPPPVPESSTLPPVGRTSTTAEASVLPGGFGVSARARRLATRLRRVTSTGRVDEAALEAACEEAIRDEQLFGGLGASFAEGDPLVAGHVGPVGVPQILQLAEGFGRPVCCRFERELEAIEVVVLGRSVRFARQENLPEIFRLGRFLVEIGVLAGRNLSEAVEDARVEGRRLGDFLAEEGVVRPEDVRAALSRQAKELVFELLAWDAGRFSVTACDPMPDEVADAEIELGLTGLVLDGLRRRDEWGPTMDSSPPTPA